MKKLRKGLLIALGILAALVIGVGVYAADYYRAEEDAVQAALATTAAVAVNRTGDGLVFIPQDAQAGFIFYPGGKVEAAAYAPLMNRLAEQGVLCVLVDMPLNLAVLDMNAAEGIAEKYPDITRWSIGGHSLGGAMAASYAAAHPEDYAGLVLLAAYSTAALPDDLAVVSVYGDADGVMNREKYEQYRKQLPEGFAEVVIPGGNHAQFGSYGKQAGDGAASISASEQIAATLEAVLPVLLGESQNAHPE